MQIEPRTLFAVHSAAGHRASALAAVNLLCGKGRYHCAISLPIMVFVLQLLYCVEKVVDIARAPSRNAWVANIIFIEWQKVRCCVDSVLGCGSVLLIDSCVLSFL